MRDCFRDGFVDVDQDRRPAALDVFRTNCNTGIIHRLQSSRDRVPIGVKDNINPSAFSAGNLGQRLGELLVVESPI